MRLLCFEEYVHILMYSTLAYPSAQALHTTSFEIENKHAYRADYIHLYTLS